MIIINSVRNSYNNTKTPIFGVNLSSPKLKFSEDDFYVRIKGYEHHSGWAKKIRKIADNAVQFIREKCNFEETLKKITFGVAEANRLTGDAEKCTHTGILRTKRQGWICDSSWDSSLGIITRYSSTRKNKYKTYADRLDYIVKNPLKNPYSGIQLSRPKHDADCFGKFIQKIRIAVIFNKRFGNNIGDDPI